MKSKYIVCGAVNVAAVEADVALGTLTHEDAHDLVCDMFGVRIGRSVMSVEVDVTYDDGTRGVELDEVPIDITRTIPADAKCVAPDPLLTPTTPHNRKK